MFSLLSAVILLLFTGHESRYAVGFVMFQA